MIEEMENKIKLDETEILIPESLDDIKKIIQNIQNKKYPSINTNLNEQGANYILFERIIKYNSLDYMENLESINSEMLKKVRLEESTEDNKLDIPGINTEPNLSSIAPELKNLLEDEDIFEELVYYYANKMKIKNISEEIQNSIVKNILYIVLNPSRENDYTEILRFLKKSKTIKIDQSKIESGVVSQDNKTNFGYIRINSIIEDDQIILNANKKKSSSDLQETKSNKIKDDDEMSLSKNKQSSNLSIRFNPSSQSGIKISKKWKDNFSKNILSAKWILNDEIIKIPHPVEDNFQYNMILKYDILMKNFKNTQINSKDDNKKIYLGLMKMIIEMKVIRDDYISKKIKQMICFIHFLLNCFREEKKFLKYNIDLVKKILNNKKIINFEGNEKKNALYQKSTEILRIILDYINKNKELDYPMEKLLRARRDIFQKIYDETVSKINELKGYLEDFISENKIDQIRNNDKSKKNWTEIFRTHTHTESFLISDILYKGLDNTDELLDNIKKKQDDKIKHKIESNLEAYLKNVIKEENLKKKNLKLILEIDSYRQCCSYCKANLYYFKQEVLKALLKINNEGKFNIRFYYVQGKNVKVYQSNSSMNTKNIKYTPYDLVENDKEICKLISKDYIIDNKQVIGDIYSQDFQCQIDNVILDKDNLYISGACDIK